MKKWALNQDTDVSSFLYIAQEFKLCFFNLNSSENENHRTLHVMLPVDNPAAPE